MTKAVVSPNEAKVLEALQQSHRCGLPELTVEQIVGLSNRALAIESKGVPRDRAYEISAGILAMTALGEMFNS